MNTIKSVKQWVWHFLLSQSKHLSPPHLWDFSRRSQEEKRTGSPRNTTSPPPSHVAEPYSPGLHVPEEFLVFCCCFLEKKILFVSHFRAQTLCLDSNPYFNYKPPKPTLPSRVLENEHQKGFKTCPVLWAATSLWFSLCEEIKREKYSTSKGGFPSPVLNFSETFWFVLSIFLFYQKKVKMVNLSPDAPRCSRVIFSDAC